jgi:hypothetical protein
MGSPTRREPHGDRAPIVLKCGGAMPETGGRGAGEGRQNPKGVVDATEARYRWSYLAF